MCFSQSGELDADSQLSQDAHSNGGGRCVPICALALSGQARRRVLTCLSISMMCRSRFLELKRPGSLLTTDDDEQGLSYARMLHPRPPLVVVTNGQATRSDIWLYLSSD